MSSDPSNFILSLPPGDGTSIGNGSMLARLRDHIPTLTDKRIAVKNVDDRGIESLRMGPLEV